MREVIALGCSHIRYVLGGAVGPDREMENVVGSIKFRGKQLGSTGATIWGLDNSRSVTGAGEKIIDFIKENSLGDKRCDLFLSLGEIDVRQHVVKHSDGKPGSVLKSIDRVLEKLDSFVSLNLSSCNSIMIMGAIPYTSAFFSIDENAPMRYVPAAFNASLHNLCNKRSWGYIDVYEGLMDKEGYLLPDFAADIKSSVEIHLDHARAEKHIVPQIEDHLNAVDRRHIHND